MAVTLRMLNCMVSASRFLSVMRSMSCFEGIPFIDSSHMHTVFIFCTYNWNIYCITESKSFDPCMLLTCAATCRLSFEYQSSMFRFYTHYFKPILCMILSYNKCFRKSAIELLLCFLYSSTYMSVVSLY